MQVIRVLYYTNNMECGCEFFNKNSNMNEIKNIAQKYNSEFETTSIIEIIDVKYMLIFKSKSNEWTYFYKDNEYDKAEEFYYEIVSEIDEQDILELVTL